MRPDIKLPEPLSYLSAPACKWGRIGYEQGDGAIVKYLDLASEATHQRLAEIAKEIRQRHHEQLIDKYFDDHPISKDTASAHLYFFMLLLDFAGHRDLGR